MNRNFQPGMHPDADQLSVFVEGAATTREQERMLAHLAECAECRKAVFLMQPHEETQRVSATPSKGFVWRRLLPVALPAAALVCGLIAVLVYIRPHGGAPQIPQQIASARQPEIKSPETTVAPTTNSEQVARSGGNKSLVPNAAPNHSRQENQAASGLNLPEAKSHHTAANIASPQSMAAAPSVPGSAAVAERVVSGGISTATVSGLPLNGRNVTNLQQLSTPAGSKGAASQNSLVNKKDLPALAVEAASGRDVTLAGLSGRVTDRSGAIVAGATITLRDASGTVRQATTSADGGFHLTGLPAGQYELTASATGFRTSEQAIELKPSELATLQPVLDVGTTSESVTVEAESAAQQIQTESANVGRVIPVPSGLPVTATVSHGKRFLSLDSAGNLFLSRNGGKKWKKVNPQWAGKAIRIELTSGSVSESAQKPNDETSGAAGKGAVFLLTTDSGTVWSSKDGAHWHQ